MQSRDIINLKARKGETGCGCIRGVLQEARDASDQRFRVLIDENHGCGLLPSTLFVTTAMELREVLRNRGETQK